MVSQALLNVLSLPDVVMIRTLTLEDIHLVRHALYFGGADGIRTHDLLDAIEARSQLRHGPTEITA